MLKNDFNLPHFVGPDFSSITADLQNLLKPKPLDIEVINADSERRRREFFLAQFERSRVITDDEMFAHSLRSARLFRGEMNSLFDLSRFNEFRSASAERDEPSRRRRALEIVRNLSPLWKIAPAFYEIAQGDLTALSEIAPDSPLLTVKQTVVLRNNSSLEIDLITLACMQGNITAVKYLLAKNAAGSYKFPEVVANLATNHNQAFYFACAFGHLEIVERLLARNPDGSYEFKSVVNKIGSQEDYNHYPILPAVCKSGNLAILERLLLAQKEDETAELGNKLRLRDFDNAALPAACENGNQKLVDRLLSKKTDGSYEFESVISGIAANDNEAFRTACAAGQDAIVMQLLRFTQVFSYAELHEREYGRYVQALVEQCVVDLQTEMTTFAQQNPSSVFDIAGQEAEIYFCILRGLIRRGEIDKINLLLIMPSVTQMAHSNDNELLKLATRLNRTDIILRLLQLPQVYNIAETHNFYSEETFAHSVDLRSLAHDRESSMIALNAAEKAIVDAVLNQYQAKMIELGGVAIVFADFKQYLKESYGAEPAIVEYNKQEIALPFEWFALQDLRIEHGEQFYQQALTAYYKNYFHTAYRYLSKPNYFIASDAAYIEMDHVKELETGQLYRYAKFEQYVTTIAYFWLATKDPDFIPTQDYTLESRKELYARDIALIGRAHNWDRSRFRADGGEEEYDDLEPDKPSCYSGVNRRLFCAVHGHALFDGLRQEVVSLEIKEFVRNYYVDLLRAKEISELQSIKGDIDEAINLDKDALERLVKLNMPSEVVAEFIKKLNLKYGAQARVFNLYCMNIFAAKDVGTFMAFYQPQSANLKLILDESIAAKSEPRYDSSVANEKTSQIEQIESTEQVDDAEQENKSEQVDEAKQPEQLEQADNVDYPQERADLKSGLEASTVAELNLEPIINDEYTQPSMQQQQNPGIFSMILTWIWDKFMWIKELIMLKLWQTKARPASTAPLNVIQPETSEVLAGCKQPGAGTLPRTDVSFTGTFATDRREGHGCLGEGFRISLRG